MQNTLHFKGYHIPLYIAIQAKGAVKKEVGYKILQKVTKTKINEGRS